MSDKLCSKTDCRVEYTRKFVSESLDNTRSENTELDMRATTRSDLKLLVGTCGTVATVCERCNRDIPMYEL